MSVPEINTDNDNIYPSRGSYDFQGKTYEVKHPSELGLKQIRMIMQSGQKIQPFANPDATDTELEDALESARKIILETSDMKPATANKMPDLEVIAYATSFFEEFNAIMNHSSRIRFR